MNGSVSLHSCCADGCVAANPESKPLSALPAGAVGVVSEITVPDEHRCRILEMGLLVGTQVELVRFAPLGDPLEIKLRGYRLTLRKHEAGQIWVKI